jgi:hypothetical protein
MCNTSNDSGWKDSIVMVALELEKAAKFGKWLWDLALTMLKNNCENELPIVATHLFKKKLKTKTLWGKEENHT